MALSVYNSGGSGANSIGNLRTIELSANPSNGGTVSGGGTASDDMVITVTAEANESEKFGFSNWKLGGNVVTTNPSYTFQVSKDYNLTAEFAELQSIAGVDWEVSQTLPREASYRSIVYGNGKFLSSFSYYDSGNYKDGIAYSEDGINWNQIEAPRNITFIAYGNGKFVALCGYDIAHSEDGINWNQVDISFTEYGKSLSSIVYGNGMFVGLQGTDTLAAYSRDGITWQESTKPYNRCDQIAYGNGKFVAIGSAGDRDNKKYNEAMYSTDGIAWTEVTTPVSANWSAIAYGNGRFVAISGNYSTYNDKAMYSDDGITWTQTTLPVLGNWTSVAYGDGKFVAVSGYSYDSSNKKIYVSNNVAYSKDGITWSLTHTPVADNWSDVTYGDGKFVAIGSNAQISSSYHNTNRVAYSITKRTNG